MGRFSPDTVKLLSRRNAIVTESPSFDLLCEGNAFYVLDHYKLQSGKTKQFLLWRNNVDYVYYLNSYARSEIPMTLNIYGNPLVTEFGDQVSEPPVMPRNLCPDEFRLPTYKVYEDGEYDRNGIHAGSMRIDIGFEGNIVPEMSILAHHPTDPAGSLIEVKNISEEDGEFNILFSWYEIPVSDFD